MENLRIPEIKISVSFDREMKKSELYNIANSRDIFELLKQIFNADTYNWTEEFIMICLNRANKVVGFYKVSSGGMTGTYCDPKVIFTVALNCAATSIILAHNHPSGNLKPSPADIEMTKRLQDGGRLLDIKILDHLILADDGYYSFCDEGMLNILNP